MERNHGRGPLTLTEKSNRSSLEVSYSPRSGVRTKPRLLADRVKCLSIDCIEDRAYGRVSAATLRKRRKVDRQRNETTGPG